MTLEMTAWVLTGIVKVPAPLAKAWTASEAGSTLGTLSNDTLACSQGQFRVASHGLSGLAIASHPSGNLTLNVPQYRCTTTNPVLQAQPRRTTRTCPEGSAKDTKGLWFRRVGRHPAEDKRLVSILESIFKKKARVNVTSLARHLRIPSCDLCQALARVAHPHPDRPGVWLAHPPSPSSLISSSSTLASVT